jgi:ubiquinone/menaquinone biosynthesis C-methylase UbiE
MASSDAEHRETTRREFAKQAGNFERPGSVFRDRDILEWIGAHVPVSAADVVLDVAGGSGRLGRYLAETAAFAVVVDLTPEMLATGAASAAEEGTRNIVFTEGDATRLPFADAQFDVVVSRFAFHHFDDPAAAAAEMARVCRPGGLTAVIDLVSEPGELGRSHNEVERLRDPSHTRALERDELVETLAGAGVAARVVSDRRQPMDARRWIEQAKPDPDVRARLLEVFEVEAGGGKPTGLRASRGDDELALEQTWVIAAGRRG